MGLDISAYSGLTKVRDYSENDDAYYNEGYVKFWPAPSFESRAAGINDDAIYEPTDSFGFRAGSYGWYNRWRNELAELGGYPTINGRFDAGAFTAAEGPFYELINFSDCEGTIGPVVATKLLHDFETYEEAAKLHPDPDFYATYRDFKRAFELAADNGAVSFH